MLNREAFTRQINVRERLPGDIRRILFVCAWAMAAFGVALTALQNRKVNHLWVDAHAYWIAWHGPMYTSGPDVVDAYLYSPAFAQAIWPLAVLPWPILGVVVSLVDAGVLVWLLRPLGRRWVVPLWLALLPEIMSGNIFIPMAAAAVLGFRYPAAWAFSALTKIAPTVMPIWWLTRREWRPLAVWAGVTGAIGAASLAVDPKLWMDWVQLLLKYSGMSEHRIGAPNMPPLIYRAPVGLLLVAYGARRGWRWAVPVGALLCTPVFWLGSYAWLAAIPRVTRPQSRGGPAGHERERSGQTASGPNDTEPEPSLPAS